jgi:fatty-acid peroxygenase
MNALSLLRNPHTFISRSLEGAEPKIKDSRVLMMPMILMKGPDAVELFYDASRFSRVNALPGWVKKTLFGEGGIHEQDADEHLHRKKLFMQVMTPEYELKMGDLFERNWMALTAKWQKNGQLKLVDEMKYLLCWSACEWAGIPLQQSELKEKADDLWLTIQGPAYFGLKHFRARKARVRLEKWLQQILQDVRDLKCIVPEDTAAYQFAHATHANGRRMNLATAAVDMMNAVRPAVAVASFIAFAALALHRNPEWKEKLEADDEKWSAPFAHEVRRFYPFVPFLAARVKTDFTWKGHQFKKDRIALIDVYGLHHDPEIYDNPQLFKPERFLNHPPGPFEFIPQGGGDAAQTHRCPGEGVVVELIKRSVSLLVRAMDFEVPQQDLEVDFREFPSIPKSGFVIEGVKLKANASESFPRRWLTPERIRKQDNHPSHPQ